jgi:hypothetical protein
LLAAVVLPAPTLHAVTKLLELLVTRLGLIPFVAVLCTSYVHNELVPSDFYEQMLTWLTILNDLSNQILHLIMLTQ